MFDAPDVIRFAKKSGASQSSLAFRKQVWHFASKFGVPRAILDVRPKRCKTVAGNPVIVSAKDHTAAHKSASALVGGTELRQAALSFRDAADAVATAGSGVTGLRDLFAWRSNDDR